MIFWFGKTNFDRFRGLKIRRFDIVVEEKHTHTQTHALLLYRLRLFTYTTVEV